MGDRERERVCVCVGDRELKRERESTGWSNLERIKTKTQHKFSSCSRLIRTMQHKRMAIVLTSPNAAAWSTQQRLRPQFFLAVISPIFCPPASADLLVEKVALVRPSVEIRGFFGKTPCNI